MLERSGFSLFSNIFALSLILCSCSVNFSFGGEATLSLAPTSFGGALVATAGAGAGAGAGAAAFAFCFASSSSSSFRILSRSSSIDFSISSAVVSQSGSNPSTLARSGFSLSANFFAFSSILISHSVFFSCIATLASTLSVFLAAFSA